MTAVSITRAGIVSCLGLGLKTNAERLLAGNSGIKESKEKGREGYFGAVSLTNNKLKTALGFSLDSVISRTALLGLAAAKEAWNEMPQDENLKCAFINASTVGGMDLTETYFSNLHANKQANPSLVAMHDLGAVTNFIAANITSFDYINTISTACSSSANAIMIGAQLINAGMFDRVLVGGTDALCNFTYQGFKSLMVLDNDWCKPFDVSRKGLNLGEGAAYLVLENEKSRKSSGNEVLAKLSGWANANDAFHNTGTSPDGIGAQLAISKALMQADLSPSEIDYINAHGTATPNNDLSEYNAMNSVFQKSLPIFSSTKAFTGHTLAASGAIEAVFSLIALNKQVAFVNLNVEEVVDDCKAISRETKFKHIANVLSNSFGFGGNCTSLIFSEA